MNFSYTELEELFKQILEIIEYVECSRLEDRRTSLFLANGDQFLNYWVPNFSIAHLLGVNTEYLQSTGLFKSKSSFEMLKEMCENPYKIHRLFKDGHLSINKVFSQHMLEKISSFKENIKINLYETEFVCAYDKNKSFYAGEKSENCDYIIVKKYNDGKIGAIYLVKNDKFLIPMSNQIFENIDTAKETLKSLLIVQEITLLTGSTTYNIKTDYKKPFYLSLNSKAEKVNELKKYKQMFNCSIDITSDHEYTLDKLTSTWDTNNENDSIIEIIVEAITTKSLIDRNKYLNSPLLSIIDACNNHICSSSTNNEVKQTYTEIITSLEEFKTKVINSEKENNILTDKISVLTEDNAVLKTDNEEQKNIIKNVYEAIKPRIK